MKNDMTIKVSDKVRSFDFEDKQMKGDRASYIEGTVIAILAPDAVLGSQCDRYQVKVSKRVSGCLIQFYGTGSDETVFPPVNGTLRTLGNVTDGVERIS